MKVESFELDQNKKIPIDDEAIDNAMEVLVGASDPRKDGCALGL